MVYLQVQLGHFVSRQTKITTMPFKCKKDRSGLEQKKRNISGLTGSKVSIISSQLEQILSIIAIFYCPDSQQRPLSILKAIKADHFEGSCCNSMALINSCNPICKNLANCCDLRMFYLFGMFLLDPRVLCDKTSMIRRLESFENASLFQ